MSRGQANWFKKSHLLPPNWITCPIITNWNAKVLICSKEQSKKESFNKTNKMFQINQKKVLQKIAYSAIQDHKYAVQWILNHVKHLSVACITLRVPFNKFTPMAS